jgi:acyl-CoA thioester hydrolase
MKCQPNPNAFAIPVRVYYEDTDAGGVVYYANYLKFFERCRTEWMRLAGYDQSQLATESGIAFVARKASCEYLKPARLDDALMIGLEVEKLTRVRVVFRQYVRRGDDELVTGSVEIACVNRLTLTPVAIPDYLYSKLEALK